MLSDKELVNTIDGRRDGLPLGVSAKNVDRLFTVVCVDELLGSRTQEVEDNTLFLFLEIVIF